MFVEAGTTARPLRSSERQDPTRRSRCSKCLLLIPTIFFTAENHALAIIPAPAQLEMCVPSGIYVDEVAVYR